MQESLPNRSVIVFPDPVYDPLQINGAAFLYFDSPLIFSIPSVVVTSGAYDLIDKVVERHPSWGYTFLGVMETRAQISQSHSATHDLLEPLSDAFLKVMYSFDAGDNALNESGDLLDSTEIGMASAFELIDVGVACGELVRHVLLEKYLEFEEDLELLFRYCSAIFQNGRLQEMLVKAYLNRVQLIRHFGSGPSQLLLTNPKLEQLLVCLPIESTVTDNDTSGFDRDVISWELFRQILANALDPINERRVEAIAEIRSSRKQEVDRLRSKCMKLAEEVQTPENLGELPNVVERFIRTRVRSEIAEVLHLDRRALETFINDLFSDAKSWSAIYSAMASAATGYYSVTLGSAIWGLSTTSAKGFKALAERRDKLRTSDYSLIYSLKGHVQEE